jgi:hypothetical protein
MKRNLPQAPGMDGKGRDLHKCLAQWPWSRKLMPTRPSFGRTQAVRAQRQLRSQAAARKLEDPFP